ncbi:MAG: phage shock protein C [Glaciecola sp.]|jgi:phage shock protein C
MKTGTTLYRDPKNGKIAGVCAGIAEYFKLETWLVRILVITAFFLMAGPFMFVTYVAAWFLLDKKPEGDFASSVKSDSTTSNTSATSGDSAWSWKSAGNSVNHDERKIEVKSRVWQAGEPPRQAFFDIQERFRVTELKLRKLEGYVTSSEFQINREISRL